MMRTAEDDGYEALMRTLSEQESGIVKICFDHMQRQPLFTMATVFGWAVARRSSALTSGFRALVEQRNSLCVLPMVRMQLDNALRLYAGFFADDHVAFCQSVFDGARIDKLEDREGKKLQDRYLVERLTERNPWIVRVYETTSGYVHLSGKHMHEIIQSSDGEQATLVIGPTDYDRAADDFLEPIRCMIHLNAITAYALSDWFARMCEPDGKIIPFTDDAVL